MEAIAHSPSFAKKAGVPQSVGKDYAAADKGKTFGKGGEMKESKAMVGKEVAFMKKKGAPTSMIKHEKAEMKGMKAGGKVRRYGAGGGPLGDESIMTDEEYAKQKEQGAKNWKSLKSFFGFGEKETPAPIDRSRDIVKKEGTKTRLISTPITETVTKISGQRNPAETSQAETTRAEPSFTQRIADQMLDREKGGSNYGADYGSDSYSDYGDNSGSSSQTFTKRQNPSSEKTTNVSSAPSRKIPAAIDSEKLRKNAEEEVLRKKPTAMTEQMRKAPTIRELYKGQKSMGDEIGDVLKSFRESIRGGLQKGKERQELKGSTMYAKGGKVKKMAMGGIAPNALAPGQQMTGATSPVLGAQTTGLKSTPALGMQSPALGMQSTPRQLNPAQQKAAAQIAAMKATPEYQAKQAKQLADYKARKVAEEATPEYQAKKAKELADYKARKVAERATPEYQAKQAKALADYRAKHGMSYTQAMAKENAAKRAKDAAMKMGPISLPQEDYDIDGDSGGFGGGNGGGVGGAKRGGQVKKMASGGYTRAADGAAKKGKTEGKVVKMASGGFVKNADGCAQRGKTKAFQVKMNRGGRC
jgi:hypothetical protein